jgi:hypothetical protein
MTTAADDPAVEDAFEAYLAGRPVPVEEAPLASFAGAVRATATRPGRPNAALAELLATGLLADQPSPSARTARSAGSPPSRGTRNRNRRRFAMIFPALIAKILSAGAVAQAAAGAGIAVVAVTGAGVAGVLPDPMQDTVAAAVETVTPFEFSEGEETSPQEEVSAEVPVTGEEPVLDEPTLDEPADEAEEQVDTTFDAAAWALAGPAQGQSFSSWVREAARHGGVDGQVVREWAHRKHVALEDLDPEELDGVGLDQLIEDTTPPAPVVDAGTPDAEPEAVTTQSGTTATSGGNGNGKAAGAGGGNANAAKGNGRN